MYKNIYCPAQHKLSGSYYTTPARCVRACTKFPCDLFTIEEIEKYIDQGFLEQIFAGFIIRREKMYLFRKKDGSLVQAPDGFDQQNPGWDEMKDVEEVLVVSKVLVPQIKLVPRATKPEKSESEKEVVSKKPRKK